MTKTWKIAAVSVLALMVFGIGIAIGDSRNTGTWPMMNVRGMGPMMRGQTTNGGAMTMPMGNGRAAGMPGMMGGMGGTTATTVPMGGAMPMAGMGGMGTGMGGAGKGMGHSMTGGMGGTASTNGMNRMGGMNGMGGMGGMNGMQMPMGTTTTTR